MSVSYPPKRSAYAAVVPNSAVLSAVTRTEEDFAFTWTSIDKERCVQRDISLRCTNIGSLWTTGTFVLRNLDKRGRRALQAFLINLHRQSMRFKTCVIKIETLPFLSLKLQRDEMMMSFDLKSGYHHFSLHPSMPDNITFHYDGRYFR